MSGNQKVSELTALTTPAADDRMPIVDVSDTTMAASGTTKYSKVSVLRTYHNLKDYAVTGDGTTDDTTAILAAITAAGSGDIVYAPTPSVAYKITSQVAVPAGITLVGNPEDTSKFYVAADIVPFLVLGAMENIYIQPTASCSGAAVYVQQAASNFNLRNISIFSPHPHTYKFVSGIYVDGAICGIIDNPMITDATTGYGIQMVSKVVDGTRVPTNAFTLIRPNVRVPSGTGISIDDCHGGVILNPILQGCAIGLEFLATNQPTDFDRNMIQVLGGYYENAAGIDVLVDDATDIQFFGGLYGNEADTTHFKFTGLAKRIDLFGCYLAADHTAINNEGTQITMYGGAIDFTKVIDASSEMHYVGVRDILNPFKNFTTLDNIDTTTLDVIGLTKFVPVGTTASNRYIAIEDIGDGATSGIQARRYDTAAARALVLNYAGGSVLIGTNTDGLTAGGSLAITQDLAHRGSKAGFYNTAPIAKQTGVAVTAAGIHAALVALGLIAA
jgi:hypothetical protein